MANNVHRLAQHYVYNLGVFHARHVWQEHGELVSVTIGHDLRGGEVGLGRRVVLQTEGVVARACPGGGMPSVDMVLITTRVLVIVDMLPVGVLMADTLVSHVTDCSISTMNEKRWSPGERLDKMEEIIGGAVNSIAALTEQAQARMPFYVETYGQQTYPVTTATAVALAVQPLAQQLVRVTGLVAIVQGSSETVLGSATLQFGNDLLLPLLDFGGALVFGLSLILPVCSRMLDSQSQKSLQLNAIAGAGGQLMLALWIWGEQIPTTGLVS